MIASDSSDSPDSNLEPTPNGAANPSPANDYATLFERMNQEVR